ncbi:hypothetical protein ABMA28_000089 [Loxostege sticticalis]|uniref:C2 domain-containing protein n=1 Tax=Loxostege sticticalis TaxID=481309 RepID=A0ABD0TR51_LOXSC
MYSRSPDRRRRQKAARASFRVENEHSQEAMPQYFQISVNVLEARKLAWSNPHSANSYVVVVLGKKKYRSTVRRNMEEPYYKECFLYEMYASIQDLQRSSLWLAVMEPRCCAPSRLLGEATIDLGTIWAQPHHQVFHKWAQLTLPRDPPTGPVGFLKVDIAIIFRGEVQVMPVNVNQQTVEEHLLPSSSEQQRANYLITVYGAFGLPSGTHCHGDRRYGKLPSTFVRVSFCGLVAKTAVQHRNIHPMYCEQVSIVEMFPNLCQLIRLEVCSAEGYFNRVLASTHLKMAAVSHDGENGFLPTFGPSLLHMYGTTCTGTMGTTGEDGPFHRGALLVSLKTVVPYYQQGVRSTSVEPVTPLKLENLWVMEDFCIYCPIFEVSMLDRRISGKFCGVALTIGEVNADSGSDEETRKLHYTGSMDVMKSKPAYGYLDFPNGYPVLQLAVRLPDFRFRMYRNNMVHGIVADLELSISDVERRLKNLEYSTPNDLVDELNKALDDAAANIIKFLDIVQYSGPASSSDDVMKQYNTDLDQKQLALQKEEMEKIYQQIAKKIKTGSIFNLIRSVHMGDNGCETKKSVKIMLAEVRAMTDNLRNLIYKTSEGWPDLVIWLLNGGSRVAYTKIPTAEIIHSVIPEQSGRHCGRIQTVYVKPLKCPRHVNTLATGCYCIAGKLEVMLWMGLYRQNFAFEGCLPGGLKLRIKDLEMVIKTTVMMLECRVFIYKAKINNVIDTSNISYLFARANAMNAVKETKVKQKSSTPVWNEVIRIQRMVFTTMEKLVSSPPVVLIEVYENDLSGRNDLVGRFQIEPIIDDRQSFEHAPKLQWYELYKGVEQAGQILMSVQLLQVPERLMKTTIYSPIEETFCASEVANEVNGNGEEVESLPSILIPQSTTYKIDVYWWGLRDVNITRKPCAVLQIDELTIKSDIICERKSNSNFPNGRTSHTFEGPLNEAYRSNLSVKLYDSGTFGRSLFLGTNFMKNPNKYIINWIAKSEREASLKSASITSSNFFQVNQMTFIKKSNSCMDEYDEFASNVSIRSNRVRCKAKRSTWSRLFCRQPAEEEFVLLPMFAKEKDQIKVVKKSLTQPEQKDWWLRYFSSDKDYETEDKSNIYTSELERQPEFSKFKDWCSSLKFYNGAKSGIPEKDEQIYCGFLKVGIALYKWPPPDDTVAVTPSGVELDNGYFDDMPGNDPAQFLVRVYLVKGVDLKTKDCTGQLDPYVILNCGKKRLGKREEFVKNTANPIFGRMYEFRCILPEDYRLMISVYDYEAIQPDELIGSTDIDLEDRIYTKHRARLGLSSEYNLTGPYKWRDCMKPSEILEELCIKNHLPLPVYPDLNTVILNGVEYKDSEKDKAYISTSERKENICLSLLHKWNTLPLCGYHLVPEHVETRSLLNPEKAGFDQGKIVMWVDMFPLDTELYIPPPVDITPRSVEEYELRLTVWDAQGLKLDDGSPANRKSTDIYVKAWIGSRSQAQDTDIHYRCTGEGNFNWRMIFSFQYQHVERKIVVKEKGPFTEYEERVPPILVVQVMDTDAVLTDDFLGTLTLDLNALPRGEKLARQCTLEAMDKAKRLNLFTMRSIRCWWPLWTVDLKTEKKGVIDIEMTLLPKEKAVLMPVGLGRNSPNPLPEPNADESLQLTIKVVAFLVFIMMILLAAIYFDAMPDIGFQSWIRYNLRTQSKASE